MIDLKDTTTHLHPIPDTQPPENYYSADRHLQIALQRYLQDDPAEWKWADSYLRAWGGVCARQIEPLYNVLEKQEPRLVQYDRRGDRVDELEFHPYYHEIGRLAYGSGIAAMCNVPDFAGRGKPASQLVKFAAMYLFTQAEGSISCPLCMTDILARVLIKYATPELKTRYLPGVTSLDYSRLTTGAMFLTERAGGSDVGATTTIARPAGEHWELFGDKWFCSNVGADVILTLARPENGPAGTKGLGLFLVYRKLPDGRRNNYRINRLKDKLGTRAMASGEVEFEGTTAYLIEPLERGFVMMMEMVNGTRLHSGVGGAGSLRRSLVEALQHTRERYAFGKPLAQQPLIAGQLADLTVDSMATAGLVLATANALDVADRPGASRQEGILSRLMISLLKRYATSRGVKGAQAALEIRGGNGYIEEWPNARILRDAYVNIIWEGGINMVSFDVLRTLEREGVWPLYAGVLEREFEKLTHPRLQELSVELAKALDELRHETARIMSSSRDAQEFAAPQLAEAMASLYAASQLARDAAFALEQSDTFAENILTGAYHYYRRFTLPLLYALKQNPPDNPDVNTLISGALI